MGYVGNNAQNGVWMTLNGGQMALAELANTDVEPAFSGVSIDSGGYGILDCDYRTPQEAGPWGRRHHVSVGGRQVVQVRRAPTARNLYTVKFFDDKTGLSVPARLDGLDGRGGGGMVQHALPRG